MTRLAYKLMPANTRRRVRLLMRSPTVVHLPDEPDEGEPQLFFVRGHPRSGTNWVGQLLNLHPAIRCVGEFHHEVFADAYVRFKDGEHLMGADPSVQLVIEANLRRLVRSSVLTAASGGMTDESWERVRWVGDRTPREIGRFHRTAPWIRIVRDGRDVAVSLTFHQMNIDGPELAKHRDGMREDVEAYRADVGYFEKHPERLLSCEGWVRHAAWLWANHQRRDQRLLDGMDEPNLLDLRYERMHADVEGERNRMYEFLGVDPKEAAPVGAGSRTAAGLKQADPRGQNRKGVVGDWRHYFTDQAKAWFKEEAGEELVRAGYETGSDW